MKPDHESMTLPVVFPVKPMLAKAVKTIPQGDYLYEPKWDGFRSIVFKDGDSIELGSRREKSMTRYFPELVDAFSGLPEHCVIDGEILCVAESKHRIDFEMLQQRIHPASSRVAKLAAQTPASFVAFDVLALGDNDHMGDAFEHRRALLREVMRNCEPPLYMSRATEDPDEAQHWFELFEGAGLDGIVAKHKHSRYEPNKRVMFKIKHERTADCVVAGYRTHKSGDDRIGSLLLGLYDDAGDLVNVGVTAAFSTTMRQQLFQQLQPLVTDFDGHPWAYEQQEQGKRTPRNAEGSRWSTGKNLAFTPLDPILVVEVKYDHMEGQRFRHTTQFVRFRPDRDAQSCTYSQLEHTARFDLADVLV